MKPAGMSLHFRPKLPERNPPFSRPSWFSRRVGAVLTELFSESGDLFATESLQVAEPLRGFRLAFAGCGIQE
jgi:hypothetical protein